MTMPVQQPRPLDPVLQGNLDEIDAIETDLERLANGLSEEQLGWRPERAAWSILQCLDHLNRTVEKYLPEIDAAIRRGRARGHQSGGASRGTRVGEWLIRTIEPPPKRRFRAPRKFQPAVDLESATVLADFSLFRNELRGRIRAADGLDLGRVRVASPGLRILRVSLGQAFRVLTSHDRRHLWQAWNVRRHEGFPGC